MKAIFLVLIASLFASEFADVEEYDAKPKWAIKIEFGNKDMFTPEFDHIDDELKINIGKIIKKVLPIVVPKIPKIGPIIAPFLSEEDMEPEVIDYDKDALADLVLAELAMDYDIDASFWGEIKKFAKKVAPVVIKTVVPMIPKVGPIIAPFLGEEDSDAMVANMTNPFAKKVHLRPHRKPVSGIKPRPRPHYKLRPHPKKFKKIIKRTPKPTAEPELDEIKLGNIFKKILPVVVPLIPKVGPIIAPFLSEEDSDETVISAEVEELILSHFADQLIEEGYELDEGFWSKVKAWIKPRIPQIIRTVVPLIPKVGPKIAPIIEPFLSEEDSIPPPGIRPMPPCPPGSKRGPTGHCGFLLPRPAPKADE